MPAAAAGVVKLLEMPPQRPFWGRLHSLPSSELPFIHNAAVQLLSVDVPSYSRINPALIRLCFCEHQVLRANLGDSLKHMKRLAVSWCSAGSQGVGTALEGDGDPST